MPAERNKRSRLRRTAPSSSTTHTSASGGVWYSGLDVGLEDIGGSPRMVGTDRVLPDGRLFRQAIAHVLKISSHASRKFSRFLGRLNKMLWNIIIILEV